MRARMTMALLLMLWVTIATVLFVATAQVSTAEPESSIMYHGSG
jgi:hypothetical protein